MKSIYGKNQITGEIKEFDCRMQDSLPVGWVETSTEKQMKHDYIQKQPHYAIIVGDVQMPINYNDQVKSKINTKYPNLDIQKLVVIKTFDGMEMMKLNTLVKLRGILEYSNITEWDDELDLLYYLPTIHCIEYKETSITDYVSGDRKMSIITDVEMEVEAHTNVEVIANQLKDTTIGSKFNRNDLIKMFKGAFDGDLLAAEYMVCQLFHSSTKRMGGVPTSKFNLNIYGMELNLNSVSNALEQVWPLVSQLELSINELNQTMMQSSQNEMMGLRMGRLQKPNHTIFIIDETNLSEGVLNANGIDNIKAVQYCMDYQTVQYRIPYGQFETDSNFNFLMLGRESSLLQVILNNREILNFH